MEQNKEKINKYSTVITKITKVAKILSIVGLVFCVLGLIFVGLAALNFDAIYDYVKANPKVMGELEIGISESKHFFITITDKTTLMELVDNKDLMMTVLGNSALDCLQGLVVCAITGFLMNTVGKLFAKLENAETPFTTELNKDLKESFIGITLLVLVTGDFVVAAIVGLALVVVYYLYQYGATLQKDVDETI